MPNRRKQDRKYIAFTAFMLICTAIVFYSIGYERAANQAMKMIQADAEITRGASSSHLVECTTDTDCVEKNGGNY